MAAWLMAVCWRGLDARETRALTLALADSFQSESEQHALEALLLLPASARALYYGKALANWLQLALLGLALVPLMVVLYDAGTTRVVPLVGVILIGSAGLSAPLG